jgi:hypothetical protein
MKQFLVESAGAVLAVRQSRDDGEPLLLLHGGPGVPDYMQAATAPMLPRFRCISFDQRGTGQSAYRDGRYELPAYLDDIEAIRTHAGVASWHVLGRSARSGIRLGLPAQGQQSRPGQLLDRRRRPVEANQARILPHRTCPRGNPGHPPLLRLRLGPGDPRLGPDLVDASRDDRDVAQLLSRSRICPRS